MMDDGFTGEMEQEFTAGDWRILFDSDLRAAGEPTWAGWLASDEGRIYAGWLVK